MNSELLRLFLFLTCAGWVLVGCSQRTPPQTPPSHKEQIDQYTQKANDFLIKDPVLWNQLRIDSLGIALFEDSLSRTEDQPECLLLWDEMEQFQQMSQNLEQDNLLLAYAKGKKRLKPWEAPQASPKQTPDKSLPLAGMRIALDPGHVGGTMELAELEKKFVRIRKGNRPEFTEEIAFNEGNLTLATAMLLRDSLEALGASVLMTREGEGQTAFGMGFGAWLASQADSAEAHLGLAPVVSRKLTPEGYPVQHKKGAALVYIQQKDLSGPDSTWWMDESTIRDIYKIPFLKSEFVERARKINAFRPDLTLIIHYNIYEKNESDRQGYLVGVDKNVSMAFVPGSFMRGELKTQEDRLAFLRLLTGNDLKASEGLSHAIVQQFESVLEVPIVAPNAPLRYLVKASLPTNRPGVFARNLSLTRMVKGPLCYGEALYQDNVEEAVQLNQKDFQLPGMQTKLPNRVKIAADAYLKGILSWVTGK